MAEAIATGHLAAKMVRIGPMATRNIQLDRRMLLAGLGLATMRPILRPAKAQTAPTVVLAAKPDTIALRPDALATPVWSLTGPWPDLEQPTNLTVEFLSELPVPAVLSWRGVDGASAAQPLLARLPLSRDGTDRFELPLYRPGTFLCDLGLIGDSQDRPRRGQPLIVRESQPLAVDRDETLLVEEWRLRTDGTAIAPAVDPRETTPFYTLNGKSSLDITARSNARLRLRFINGSHRTIVGLKLESLAVRVMAIDSQPAEPFLARNGALVVAPGGRVDILVDLAASAGSAFPILLHDGRQVRQIGRLVVTNDAAARAAPLPPAPPLPSNGLPATLDLKNALRVDLALGGPVWIAPTAFTPSAAPAFRAKAGRTVVLALANRADKTSVFHLHGHHFRLLDRLDDGWKPFWLDTLAIEPGQTQRIAFAAQHAGRFLMEAVAADWAAPRLVQWYAVE